MRTLLCAHLREGLVYLNAAESHHLIHVLRTARGAPLRVQDGLGNAANAVLVGVSGGIAELEVGVVAAAPAAPERIVLLGTPRPALMEEAATLATEGGATALWLVTAARSPPGNARLERLERVVDSAVKQCRRPVRPALAAYPTLETALTALAARQAAAPLSLHVAQPGGPSGALLGPLGGAALAVGPEGGWAPPELTRLAEAGFAPLGLGPYVLRAPTAVLAGLAALAVGRVSCW